NTIFTCVVSATPVFCSNQPTPPHLSTLSLHDALPISPLHRMCPLLDKQTIRSSTRHHPDRSPLGDRTQEFLRDEQTVVAGTRCRDRKSTRLNSSHVKISYAVFCLKKKKPYDTAPRARG